MECQEVTFFSDKLSIDLPQNFEDMEEDQKDIDFPYQIRPQIIKKDMQEEMILTLSLLEQRLEKKQAASAVLSMKRLIDNAYPNGVLTRVEEIGNQDNPSAWFGFKTDYDKGEDYHIIFAISLDKKFLLGGLHSPMERCKQCEGVLRTIMSTMRVNKNNCAERKR